MLVCPQRNIDHFLLSAFLHPYIHYNISMSLLDAKPPKAEIPVSAILNRGQFCSPGEIWQCLDTILTVVTERGCRLLLAGRGEEFC